MCNEWAYNLILHRVQISLQINQKGRQLRQRLCGNPPESSELSHRGSLLRCVTRREEKLFANQINLKLNLDPLSHIDWESLRSQSSAKRLGFTQNAGKKKKKNISSQEEMPTFSPGLCSPVSHRTPV